MKLQKAIFLSEFIFVSGEWELLVLCFVLLVLVRIRANARLWSIHECITLVSVLVSVFFSVFVSVLSCSCWCWSVLMRVSAASTQSNLKVFKPHRYTLSNTKHILSNTKCKIQNTPSHKQNTWLHLIWEKLKVYCIFCILTLVVLVLVLVRK